MPGADPGRGRSRSSAGQAESGGVRVKDGVLEQTVIELGPEGPITRATDDAEEVLFVVSGQGELRLHGKRYALAPRPASTWRRAGVRAPQRGVRSDAYGMRADP